MYARGVWLGALLAALVLLRPAAAQENEKPPLLAVLAHPDDETAAGPLLAKYAALGYPVYLASVTSGQKGVTAHANIPAGAELGKTREAELACACRKLGINTPFLLQFEDQGLSDMTTHHQLAARLREILNVLQPEVVITWGPDGFSGHPDHRTVSAVVTEIVQQSHGLRRRPRKLYYLAIPESLTTNLPPPFHRPGALRAVADTFITTEIDGADFLDAAAKAVACHQSQWTPEEMEGLKFFGAQILKGKIYLRLALSEESSPIAREEDLLEGIR